MPLTPDEFDEACRLTCKHCATGSKTRYRTETKEHVHDLVVDRGASKVYSHAYCLASGLRRFYEAKQNG